jgi:hypothetical protein
MNTPLSDEDLHAVRQILVVVEDHLSRNDEFEHDWTSAAPQGGAPERVWIEVIRQARNAGWEASNDAGVVKIRKS